MDEIPLPPRDDKNEEPVNEQPESIPVPPVEPVAELPVPPGLSTPQEEIIVGQPAPESVSPLPPPPPPPPSFGTPLAEFGAPSGYAIPAQKGRNWLLIIGIVLGICLLLICLMICVLVMLAPSISDVLSNIIETLEASATPD